MFGLGSLLVSWKFCARHVLNSLRRSSCHGQEKAIDVFSNQSMEMRGREELNSLFSSTHQDAWLSTTSSVLAWPNTGQPLTDIANVHGMGGTYLQLHHDICGVC